MQNFKYFTKELLVEYNNVAIREKRNKAIKEEILEEIPDHYALPIIKDFYHQKGEMRVMVSLIEKGIALLDMSNERYDMLPVAKWNNKKQEYSFEAVETIRKRFPYKNREWTQTVVKKPYRK